MTLWQAIKLLKRRWWWIALITGVVTGAVFTYYWTKPNEWEGVAVIAEYRALQSNRTVIYPDPYTLQVDLITRLQNMANVVRSYTVLLSTWRELRDSGNWAPAETIRQNYPPNEQDLRGALDLLNRLEIKPIPNTEYLSVSIRTQGDEEARRQAEYAMTILLSKFQEHYSNLNAQVARPSREFVQRQYEDAQREYERATRQLSEYLNQNKDVIQGDNQTNLLLQQIARFEAQLYDAITAQQSAAARLARLTQQLEQEARRPGGGEYRNLSKVVRLNPILQQLQARLAESQNELQGLIARGIGPEHPDYKRIQGRIEELEKQIKEQQTMILEAETTGVNNLFEALKRDYLAALVDRNVADERVRELRAQVAELRGRLENLPERQRIAQELTLKVELARNRLALLKNKLDEAITRENELQTAGFVKVIDGPVSTPVDKNIPLRVALAFALSLILSIGLVLLVGQVDQGVYTPSQAEALFGIPTIAALPRMRRALLARDRAEQTPLSASYQLLSTSIAQANGRLNGNALAITGAEADVGRTTVAYNLALTLVRDGARVVLIDADMRNPNLHRLVRADVNHPGLADILLGKVSLEQAVQQTAIEGLVFIGAGTPPDNPVRLLRSPQMHELLQKLKSVADFVIIDTPSAATFADSLVVGTVAGNVLIVHAAGQGMTEATREVLARFKQHEINMVGVVLNKVRLDDSVVFQQFQRGYYRALEARNGAAERAALPPSSRVDSDSEPEQTTPRD
ncbi:MAG: polysaccharide biosynthesis tyrosine autokinase [Armatimonadetes bacterium]|nr:polysaccharide biosynthesis tyrosine autokinase [Armatimonadota bacterium]CUU33969.1 capsular exopolysaccharide family [Armatimonadetes bacterium DC]